MFSADVPIKAVSAGAAGSLARLTSIPFDVLRLEMVNSQKSLGMFKTIKHIVTTQGVNALFKGYKSALSRQMVTSGISIGGYDTLKARSIEYNRENPEGYNIAARLGAGFAAGGTASFVTRPRPKGASIIKAVTPIKDAIERYRESLKEHKGDISILHHLKVIKKYGQQYFSKLCQNGFITVAEVVSYDVIKESLIEVRGLKDEMPVHILSAILCGCFTVLTTAPFYSLRQQYYAVAPGTYRNILACSIAMYKTGGLRAFYPGFRSNLIRMLIFNITLWTSYEQLKNLYPMWQESRTSD